MRFLNRSRIFQLITVVAVVSLIGAGYFYFQYRQVQKELSSAKPAPDQATLQSQENKRLIEEIGKLIQLPEGEEPQIATVTDIEKLKDQAFFQKAKNGDKVLIYTSAKKAILYDPDTKKIVDTAPLNIGSSRVKVVLRNGTTTSGLTSKLEPTIKQINSQIDVVAKENASGSAYEKTLVVNLNNDTKDSAAEIAKAINATALDSLPSGETKPAEADVVVIIGKDKSSI